ncbi:hypothetical protein ACQFYA_20505 [Promicromonospora sp. Marseille-Q5078]
MTLQGDVGRDTGREEAALLLVAALGVMTASVSVAILGPWAPIVGVAVLALIRLGLRRPVATERSRLLRGVLTWALVGWTAVAAFMGAALLMVGTDID